MIPTTAYDIERQGSLEPERTVAMTFDENSIAHIMSVLTDLYSDPMLAVIREYSTNGADSHTEAGQTWPIEITLPTPLNPYFKVRDFGVGLSVDDIERIYSKYGASSKRDTNDQTGMLGLGCKSALTFTPQFNVVAVKNGVKAHVSVSRRQDGTGVMEIIDTCSTNESNGVLVTIPVASNHGEFVEKAKKFFSFWREGSVLIDGKPAERFKGIAIADNLYMVPGLDQDYVVMGNVAYGVETRIYNRYRYWGQSWGVVAYVPIGSMHFTPSRESLHFTSMTEAAIEKIAKQFLDNYARAAKESIDACDTKREALKVWLDWNKSGIDVKQEYRGVKIEDRWMVGNLSFRPYVQRNNTYDNGYIGYSEIENPNYLIVEGQRLTSLSTVQRKKVRIFIEEMGYQVSYVIFVESIKPFVDWVEPANLAKWDDINSIKIKQTRNPNTGTFTVVTDNGYTTEIKGLPQNKQFVYYGPNDEYNFYNSMSWFKDVMVVKLGQNRWDKFKRENPGSMHVRDYVSAKVKEYTDSVTTEMVTAIMAPEWHRTLARRLDLTKIDDPDVVDYLTTIRNAKVSDAWTRCQSLASRFHAPFRVTQKGQNDPFSHYPLTEIIRGAYNADYEHYTIYLNAAYAARKESE